MRTVRPNGLLVASALALVALHGAAGAGADTGVSIDVGKIAISQKLTPGGGYRLPTFGVRNPGTEPSSYRLRVTYLEGQVAKRPPGDWFHFAPAKLVLGPNETQPVQVRLVLPTGADPGDYEALVGAEIASDDPGARVGAAAAARVTFTVEPANILSAWWLKLRTFLSDGTPWTWLVPVVLVLGTLTLQMRRRFTLSVRRRA